MTDKIINFRKGKKRVARAQKEQRATENRVKFGRTKAEKLLDTTRDQKAKSYIDGHKREDD